MSYTVLEEKGKKKENGRVKIREGLEKGRRGGFEKEERERREVREGDKDREERGMRQGREEEERGKKRG